MPKTKKERLEYKRNYYAKNKIKFRNLVNLRRNKRLKLVADIKIGYQCQNPNCQTSGYLDFCQLDFHHLEKNDENIIIGANITLNKEKLAKEINKCTVLCANCHRLERTGKLLGGFKRCNVSDELIIIQQYSI